MAIVVDATDMYVAGYDTHTALGNEQWRIEKRKLSDGSLDASFGSGGVVTSDPNPTNDDAPWAIAIDSTGLSVAGYDAVASGADEWRIEKRAK